MTGPNKGVATLRVCDIMRLPSDVARGCDMTFTDPPWENSALRMFETIMAKAGTPKPGNDIDAVLDRLFLLAPKDKPCFVEYSVKGHTRVIRCGLARGHQLHRVIHSEYVHGPQVVVQFNSDMPLAANVKGWGVLDAAIAYHKPACIFEPFAGHGVHAARMVKLGVNVVASELNPARAAKAFKALGLVT